jgi:hypothetical protein
VPCEGDVFISTEKKVFIGIWPHKGVFLIVVYLVCLNQILNLITHFSALHKHESMLRVEFLSDLLNHVEIFWIKVVLCICKDQISTYKTHIL